MTPTKSCPVVLRNSEEIEILAFQHPITSLQLVKGPIESGENPTEAAVRELAEEAGILAASITSDLGLWESGYQDQIWLFHLCKPNAIESGGVLLKAYAPSVATFCSPNHHSTKQMKVF